MVADIMKCLWKFSGGEPRTVLQAGGFLQSELVFDTIFDELKWCNFSTFDIRWA